MSSGKVARRSPHTLWHWATPQAETILATRDLGEGAAADQALNDLSLSARETDPRDGQGHF
ncbi:hypothetical protein [Streptomyces sp. NPDC059010]|uniref:hypothetical protein n=1 Tax=Streptomyces sp. NPDC059010 TaxID=3346695 RepID=UPI003692654A